MKPFTITARAAATSLPAHKHYANQWQEFSQTRKEAPEMGKINEFLGFSCVLDLHTVNGLYVCTIVPTIEASRRSAGCHIPLHAMAQHCDSSLHTYPAGFQRNRWRTMEWSAFLHIPPPLLRRLMKLRCVHVPC